MDAPLYPPAALPADTTEYVANWGRPDERASWTWPEPGTPMSVRLYTTGDRVELQFDEAKVGGQALGPGDRKAPEAESFRGQALAILRSTGGRGTVRIEVSSEGLRGASTTIKLV